VRKNHKVHRLVAEAFIPNTENKPTVNHIDSNRLNNNIDNLEWATMYEQNLHSRTYGNLVYKGDNAPNAKLNWDKVDRIRFLLENTSRSQQSIADEYNVNQRTIWNIKHNKRWIKD
jgi:hypothetical protein